MYSGCQTEGGAAMTFEEWWAGHVTCGRCREKGLARSAWAAAVAAERERCAKVVDFHHTLERLAVEAGDGEVRAVWRLEDAAKQIRSEVAS